MMTKVAKTFTVRKSTIANCDYGLGLFDVWRTESVDVT